MLITIICGWRAGLGLVGVLAISIALVVVPVWRGVGQAKRCLVWTVLAALAAALGFALAGAWYESRAGTHPLRQLPAGSVVTADAVVGDPEPLPGRSFGGRQWVMRATVHEFRWGTHTVDQHADVTVLMPEQVWSELVPGQRVSFRARLDRPWRHDLTVAVLRAQGPPNRIGPRPWWQAVASAVRDHLAAASRRALPPDAAGLLPGLIDGDISRLPDNVRENFKEVDLTHLVAVSGTNVSIVLAAVLLGTRALTFGPRWSAAVATVALIAFVILARPSPSVLRAAAMGAVAVLAILTGRRKQALPALCTAVIVLIALSPELSVDIGFALSVAATLSLILVAPIWSRWLESRGWPQPLAEAFGVAAAAFAVTTPIIAALTGHISGVAILANVLVEPVVAPITLVGALAALLSCVYPPVAVWLLDLTEYPLKWLLFVAEHGASLGISLPLPKGLAGAGVAMVLVIGAVAVLGALGRYRGPGPGIRPVRTGQPPRRRIER
ncbi:MAG: ComEC/Rec2 family competence protein [Nocardia sp.]|nr:ComEC/Rec2 family competence protein [Nocardia sp.]